MCHPDLCICPALVCLQASSRWWSRRTPLRELGLPTPAPAARHGARPPPIRGGPHVLPGSARPSVFVICSAAFIFPPSAVTHALKFCGPGGKTAGLARCPRYDLTCEQRTCGALQPLRAVTLLSHKLCAWSLAVSCALRAQVGQSPTGPEPALAISALPRPDCDRLAYSRRSSRTRHAAALQAQAQLPPPPPPAVCRGAAQPSTSPCLFFCPFRQLLPCHLLCRGPSSCHLLCRGPSSCHLRRRGPSSCHLRRRGPAHHIP